MSLMRTITGIVKNYEETSEHNKLPELRTKYYKISKAKLVTTVQEVIKRSYPSWKVLHVDQERGELTIEKSGIGAKDIVITVYSISPVRSAIDMVVTKRSSMGDLGSTYRTILDFFATLHKEITPEK